MKNLILRALALPVLLSLMAVAARADDLGQLAGKWTVKKTNDEGRSYTQTIEIKKDKLTFKIAGADKEVRMCVEGNIKLEKAGPFKVMKLEQIKAGRNAEEMNPVDGDRQVVYQIFEDTLSLAVNFDRDEKPMLDTYKKE